MFTRGAALLFGGEDREIAPRWIGTERDYYETRAVNIKSDGLD